METYCLTCKERRKVPSYHSFYEKCLNYDLDEIFVPLQVGVCPKCHRLLSKLSACRDRYLGQLVERTTA
jgi:hypothetical protein